MVCVHERAAFSISLVGHLSTFLALESVTQNIVSAREDELTHQCRKFDGSLVARGPRVERP